MVIASDEPARLRLARQVEQHARQPAGIEQADGQDGRELDDEHQHVEALDRVAQEFAGQDQVAGRRDRDELGDALDDAEDQRVEQVAVGQAGNSMQVGREGWPGAPQPVNRQDGGGGPQGRSRPRGQRPPVDPGQDVGEHPLALVVAQQQMPAVEIGDDRAGGRIQRRHEPARRLRLDDLVARPEQDQHRQPEPRAPRPAPRPSARPARRCPSIRVSRR